MMSNEFKFHVLKCNHVSKSSFQTCTSAQEPCFWGQMMDSHQNWLMNIGLGWTGIGYCAFLEDSRNKEQGEDWVT